MFKNNSDIYLIHLYTICDAFSPTRKLKGSSSFLYVKLNRKITKNCLNLK